MGISRKDLEAMGIEPEKIESIIAAHIGVVNALKDECDTLKAKATQFDAIQKELETLKTNGSDWQKKYEDEHNAFEEYKTSVVAAESTRKKSDAYRSAMKKANIPEQVIDKLLKIADVENVKLDETGKVTNLADVEKDVKENFGDYIVHESTDLDKPDTPPASPKGKDAFDAMTLTEQMRYANEHPDEVAGYLGS